MAAQGGWQRAERPSDGAVAAILGLRVRGTAVP
jgi:hypothetical protein